MPNMLFEELEEFKPLLEKKSNLDAPYVLCNEQKQQEILENLNDRFQSPQNEAQNSLHVGFSVWFNLDIICTTKPQYALVFDIDPAVCDYVYPILESQIKNSGSRDEFVSGFIKKLTSEPNISMQEYPLILNSNFKELMTKNHGFLADDDQFNYLKNMIQEDRVFFGKLDMTNSEGMGKIQKWIDKNKLNLQTLYLSNIPEWIREHQPVPWCQTEVSIRELIQNNTLLIDAFYPTTRKDNSGPPLRVTQGGLPEYKVSFANKRINPTQEDHNLQQQRRRNNASRSLFPDLNVEPTENLTSSSISTFTP